MDGGLTGAPAARAPAGVPPLPLARGANGVLLVAALWIGFGLFAGLVEYFTITRSLGLGSAYIVRGPVLASAIWIPLTLCAVRLARRRPLAPLRVATVLLHLALAVAASFALNLAWGGFHVAIGSHPWPERGFLPGVTWAGVRNLHLNAGTWMAIAVFVTAWTRRPAAAEARESGRLAGGGGDARPADAAAYPVDGTTAEAAPRNDAQWARTLSVRVGSRTHVVPVEAIDRIQGAGDYVRLHAGERRYLMAERLKTLERRLDPAVFARVHRSTIVNLTRITRLEHRSHGDYEARLEDGTTVRISRSRSDAIRDLL